MVEVEEEGEGVGLAVEPEKRGREEMVSSQFSPPSLSFLLSFPPSPTHLTKPAQ